MFNTLTDYLQICIFFQCLDLQLEFCFQKYEPLQSAWFGNLQLSPTASSSVSVCWWNDIQINRYTYRLHAWRPVSDLSSAYQIKYRLNSSNSNSATVEVLNPSTRQYTVNSLKAESVYMFSITAQTRKGWGDAADALVVTTEKRGIYISYS